MLLIHSVFCMELHVISLDSEDRSMLTNCKGLRALPVGLRRLSLVIMPHLILRERQCYCKCESVYPDDIPDPQENITLIVEDYFLI